MRTLKFELIEWERDYKDPKTQVERWIDRIVFNLSQLRCGVSCDISNVRVVECVFQNDGHTEKRASVTGYVTKTSRKTTWDDVMDAINKVYAPRYQWC